MRRVQAGECFEITRRGQPVAMIVPVQEPRRALLRGSARHDGYFMAPDFDAPLEELSDYA